MSGTIWRALSESASLILVTVALLQAILVGLACVGEIGHSQTRAAKCRIGCAGLLLVGSSVAIAAVSLGVWQLDAGAVATVATLAAILGALLLHAATSRTSHEQTSRDSDRFNFLLLGALLAIVAAFLIHDLGSWSGGGLTWESEVLENFLAELAAPSPKESLTTVGLSALLTRLRWGQGLVSSGQDSLLYGLPTLIALLVNGFSFTSLRIVSVVWTLVAGLLLYIFCARGRSGSTALWAAVLFLCNPVVLYYARYATAVSATFAAVLVALCSTHILLCSKSFRTGHVILCALGLFIATLTYAVGRLVVVFLTCLALWFLVMQIRAAKKNLLGLLVFLGCISAVVFFQHQSGTLPNFLHARGEQVVTFVSDPGYQRTFFGLNEGQNAVSPMTRIIGETVSRRAPELLEILSPVALFNPGREGVSWIGDPPRISLYLGVLLPTLLIGLATSFQRMRRLPAILLVGAALSTLVPLLGTSRVDIHRASIAVIPMVVWLASGLETLRDRVPSRWRSQATVVILTLLCASAIESLRLLRPDQRLSASTSGLITAVGSAAIVPSLGYAADHTEVTALNLALAQKLYEKKLPLSALLHRSVVNRLLNAQSSVEVHQILVSASAPSPAGAILLLPAERFKHATPLLQQAGYTVESIHFGGIAALNVVLGASGRAAAELSGGAN